MWPSHDVHSFSAYRPRPFLPHPTQVVFNMFLFITILITLIPASSAAVSSPPLAPRDDVSTPAQSTTTTIAVASAVSIASSVSSQASQLATIPAIPVPSNVTNAASLSQLASIMPPLQTIAAAAQNARRAVTPDEEVELLASLMPPLHPATNATINASSPVERDAPLRVMVVGDSMTQGAEGDFTWRYCIWQWFQSQGIAVDFVGPYVGTQDAAVAHPPTDPPLYESPPPPNGPLRTSGGYAAGISFDSNHFAIWGRAAAVDKGLIHDIVAAYSPDLMLLMLGFNDMGWFYSDEFGTLDSVHTLINNARAAQPNLMFAVANVPQRTSLGRIDLPLKTGKSPKFHTRFLASIRAPSIL